MWVACPQKVALETGERARGRGGFERTRLGNIFIAEKYFLSVLVLGQHMSSAYSREQRHYKF
jgi:hypothetical protein